MRSCAEAAVSPNSDVILSEISATVVEPLHIFQTKLPRTSNLTRISGNFMRGTTQRANNGFRNFGTSTTTFPLSPVSQGTRWAGVSSSRLRDFLYFRLVNKGNRPVMDKMSGASPGGFTPLNFNSHHQITSLPTVVPVHPESPPSSKEQGSDRTPEQRRMRWPATAQRR
jgi:hypothetical protein